MAEYQVYANLQEMLEHIRGKAEEIQPVPYEEPKEETAKKRKSASKKKEA